MSRGDTIQWSRVTSSKIVTSCCESLDSVNTLRFGWRMTWRTIEYVHVVLIVVVKDVMLHLKSWLLTLYTVKSISMNSIFCSELLRLTLSTLVSRGLSSFWIISNVMDLTEFIFVLCWRYWVQAWATSKGSIMKSSGRFLPSLLRELWNSSFLGSITCIGIAVSYIQVLKFLKTFKHSRFAAQQYFGWTRRPRICHKVTSPITQCNRRSGWFERDKDCTPERGELWSSWMLFVAVADTASRSGLED